MGAAGRLIYQRRTGRWVWLLTLVAAAAAFAAALDDGDWRLGILPAIVSVIGAALIFWIAIGWAGRTRLAEIWLDGDVLLARQGHAFDRGKVLRIPLSEARNWRPVIERYGQKSVEAAEFDHKDVTYTLQISGAEYADLDTLNAWIDEQRPAERPPTRLEPPVR